MVTGGSYADVTSNSSVPARGGVTSTSIATGIHRRTVSPSRSREPEAPRILDDAPPADDDGPLEQIAANEVLHHGGRPLDDGGRPRLTGRGLDTPAGEDDQAEPNAGYEASASRRINAQSASTWFRSVKRPPIETRTTHRPPSTAGVR